MLAFVDDAVMNVRASDETLAAVSKHLPPRQCRLVMTAGCYRMLCMMLETCGVEIERHDEIPQLTQAEWQTRLRLEDSR